MYNMKREILIKVVIDWEDYDDVCDEIVLDDCGIYDALKDGVSILICDKEETDD